LWFPTTTWNPVFLDRYLVTVTGAYSSENSVKTS
jgi:hypothetical protein